MAKLWLSNGQLRATLIQRFDGSALLVGPKGEKVEFNSGTGVKEARFKAAKLGWRIAVEHPHRAVVPCLSNGGTEEGEHLNNMK